MDSIQDYFKYDKKILSIYLSFFIRDNSIIIDQALIHFEKFVIKFCLKSEENKNNNREEISNNIENENRKFIIDNDILYILDILYFMEKKSSLFLYLEIEFRRMNTDRILFELNNLNDVNYPNNENNQRNETSFEHEKDSIEEKSLNSNIKYKKHKTTRSFSSNNFNDIKFKSSNINSDNSNSSIREKSYNRSVVNRSKSQKTISSKNSNISMLKNVRSRILDQDIEVKQVTIIKDLFLQFPFLPSKISICKITSILLKYTNSYYQCSFLLGVTKKIFKEDSLMLQKAAIISICNIYNFFNDYILDSIRNSKVFDIFVYDALLQNIDEILSRIIQLENDNKYYLIEILGELVGIFYGLDCQDNSNMNSEDKKNVSIINPDSSIKTINILDFKEDKSEVKIQIKDGLNLFNKLLSNRKKSLRLSLINTNLKNISMGSYNMNSNITSNKNSNNQQITKINLKNEGNIDKIVENNSNLTQNIIPKLEFTISSEENDNSNTKRSKEEVQLTNDMKIGIQKKDIEINNNVIKEADEYDERLETNEKQITNKDTEKINDDNKIQVNYIEKIKEINNNNNLINQIQTADRQNNISQLDSINKSIESKYSVEDFLNLYKILFNEQNWRFRLKLAKSFPFVVKRVMLYGVIRMENKKAYYKLISNKENMNNQNTNTNNTNNSSNLFNVTNTIDGDAKLDIILEYKKFRHILLDLIEHFNLLLTDKVIDVKIQAFDSLIPTLKFFSDCFNYSDSLEFDDNNYKLNSVVVWRLASTFNFILLNGESSIELKVSLSKCIRVILTVIDFFELIDKISLVIDYLINDNNLLVKMEISNVMYDIFNVKILHENGISLKNYSFKDDFFNNDIKHNFSEYIKLKTILPFTPIYKRDLEHFSILKRFLLDKDYRIRKNSIKMCFRFYIDFGIECFVNNFLDFFVEGFEDTCCDIRDYTNKCLEEIINAETNENHNFILFINVIINKFNKYFDQSNKIKYQITITLIKSMFIMLDCKHVYKYVKEHFFKHIQKITSVEKQDNITIVCVIIKEIINFKNRSNEEINDKFIKLVQTIERSNFFQKDIDISFYLKKFNFRVL